MKINWTLVQYWVLICGKLLLKHKNKKKNTVDIFIYANSIEFFFVVAAFYIAVYQKTEKQLKNLNCFLKTNNNI